MDDKMKNIPKYPAKDPADETADVKAVAENAGEPTEANVPVAENGDIEEIVVTDKAEPVESIVEFSKKYRFEGKVVKDIDLSALEDLNQKAAKTIEKVYKKLAKGNVSVQPELTDEYAIATASYITGMPVEFFEQIRHRDIIKIRNRVINFTFGD